MSDLLDGIPTRPQRQDSVIDQLQDLARVAARLGMYDAADSIKQSFELGKFSDIRYRSRLGDIQMTWNNENPTWPDDPYDEDQEDDCE